MIRVNLLPRQPTDTRFFGLSVAKRELNTGALVFLGCLLALVIFHFVLVQRVASEQADLDSVNNQIAALAPRTNDVGQLSADVRRLQEIDRAAIWLHRSGQTTALRLAYLGNAIPQGAWIERVAQDSHGWTIKGSGKDLQSIGSVVRGISHVSPGLQTLFQAVNTEQALTYQMTIADPQAPPTPMPVATDSILK
jgi:Tfp pilus assembly protein PilN